ncbi:MAG: flagellar biosynthesis anti-sigma factor FlgM [Thermoanaerobacterales bacterium]|nr:flagellar biosynthesis anti-sigma factor FlgM [Bacillota bacterium]MDI6906165.1 flagellar biosynthesis anti-sigma factor FlgM [Thermoanaerobacterales bacterium]
MRIDGFNIDPIKVYREQIEQKERAEGRRSAAEQASTLEISERTQELQVYQARLKEMPDIREELVEKVRREVDEGTYRPDATRIARGMIREALLDRRV